MPIWIPWLDFYFEASYRVGVDFRLYYNLENSRHEYNITEEDLFHEKEGILKVERVWTMWEGPCYKFTPLYQTVSDAINFFGITFNKTMPAEDVPNIIVIFTSEKESFGLAALEAMAYVDLLDH